MTSSILDVLSKIFFFSDMSPQELHEIAQAASLHHYRSKSNVFMEGEDRQAVYFIHRGVIKIYKVDQQGNEVILNFLKSGEMFPHSGFFESTPYPGTAEVVLDAELCAIMTHEFEKIILGRPEMAVKLMRVMGRKIRELQTQVRDLSSVDINFRIAALLIRLAKEFGEPGESGTSIKLKTTNTDLARMAGTTRETVNRFISRLKKENLLLDESRQLILTDLAGLEHYVQ